MIKQADNTNSPRLAPLSMSIGSSWCTYEDSVIAHTDNDGRLSDANCMKLCSDHDVLWSDAVKDLGDYGNHAETLLGWLGY